MKKMIAFRIDTKLLARLTRYLAKGDETRTALIERLLEQEVGKAK